MALIRLSVWLGVLRRGEECRSARGAAAAFAIAVLGLGGCAQSPPQVVAGHHPKEYFPSSVYGPASRRVVADGEPIPHGGGQYLVGKPYTIAGQTYYPSERKIRQVGLASWYGDAFHGRLTANGEIYDRDGFTAAHPTMPLPSYARVTNLRNHYSMIVRVNDRGPYHSNRIMDVSRRVAEALDFQRGGTSLVKVEYVGHASLAGSDDARLYATLQTNGPARLDGEEVVAAATPKPTMPAAAEPEIPQPGPSPADPADEDSTPTATVRRHRAPAAPANVVAAAHTPVSRPSAGGQSAKQSPAELMASGRQATDRRFLVGRERISAGRLAAVKPETLGQKGAARTGRALAVALPPARPVRLASMVPSPPHRERPIRTAHAHDD